METEPQPPMEDDPVIYVTPIVTEIPRLPVEPLYEGDPETTEGGW